MELKVEDETTICQFIALNGRRGDRMSRVAWWLAPAIVALSGLSLVLAFGGPSRAQQQVPGTLDGGASVSLHGSAQYSVQLAAPEGTAGMTPKLTLAYDSNGGPGVFGLGWSLSGYSFISRTGKNLLVDGKTGGVEFSDDDALILDGARLIPAREAPGFLAKVVDDQTRVEIVGSGSARTFIARTKSGLRMHYGIHIKTASGRVLAWACSRVEDTFGNSIEFEYEQNNKGDWGLKRALYTKNATVSPPLVPYAEVVVSYRRTAKPTVAFILGEEIVRELVAESIESRIDGKAFRKYEFIYDEVERLGARRITQIVETGAFGERRPATQFRYENPKPGWIEQPLYNMPDESGPISTLESGYRMLDLDGDGVAEIVYAGYVDGKLTARTYKNEASGWQLKPDLALPDRIANADGSDAGTFFFDVNEDGKLDFLISRSLAQGSERVAYQQDGKWTAKPEFAFPEDVVANGQRKLLLTPWEVPGGKSLLTVSREGSLQSWKFQANAWMRTAIAGIVPLQESSFSSLMILADDFDCDGRQDIAIVDVKTGLLQVLKIESDLLGRLSMRVAHVVQTEAPVVAAYAVRIGTCSQLIAHTNSGIAKLFSLRFDRVPLPGAFVFSQIDLGSLGGAIVSRVTPGAILRSGRMDLILQLAIPSTAEVALLSYDDTQRAWIREPNYDYRPQPGTERVDQSYIPYAFDVDGNGKPDVLLLPTVRMRPAVALLNQQPGWRLVSQFIPNIVFSEKGKAAGGPQFVDLNGDGLPDLIAYHLDENNIGAASARLNSATGWVADARFNPPKPLSRSKGGLTGMLIDVTGDGVPDLLHAHGGERDFWKSAFDTAGRPVGWQADPGLQYQPPENFYDERLGDLGVRFLDVNGDGRIDMVVSRREQHGGMYARAYLNTGTGWDASQSAIYAPPIPFVSRLPNDVAFEFAGADYFRDLKVQLLDINGDGLLDIVYWYRFRPAPAVGGNVGAEPQRGCQNVPLPNPRSTPANPLPPIPPQIPALGNCAGAYLNTGRGWTPVQNQAAFLPIPLDLSIDRKNASVDFADVNGDGLVDLIPAQLVGGNNALAAYMNIGAGWRLRPEFAIPAEALSASEKLVSHRLIDLNGDGLPDLTYNRPGAKGAFLNIASGWSARADAYAPPVPFVDDEGSDLGIRLVDVNGDGLSDVLRHWKDKNGAVHKAAYLNTGSRPDVLLEVTNGLQTRTTFDYRSLLTLRDGETGEDRFYRPDPISEYPIISFVPTTYAVSKFSIIEPDSNAARPSRFTVSTSYRYEGFRFDVQAGVPLGFKSKTATNSVTGTVERTELYQDFFRNGRVRATKSKLSNVVLNQTDNDYSVRRPAGSGLPVRVELRRSLNVKSDLDGSLIGKTTEDYEYDESGNALSVCLIHGDGSWTYTHNEYRPNAQNLDLRIWYLGRLTQSRFTHATAEAGQVCRDLSGGARHANPDHVVIDIAEFEYEPIRGTLRTETAHAGKRLALAKIHTRDGFGNVVSTEARADREESRTTSTTFDTRGRFEQQRRNALGHTTSRVLHPVLGLPVELTDPNGVISRVTYDGFGRTATTTSSTQVLTTNRLIAGAGESVRGRVVAMKSTMRRGDLPEQETWLDGQGRTLRIASQGFGNRRVLQDSEYDVLGRLVAKTNPYFERDLVFETATEYDALNRPKKVTRPDGAVTETIYSGTKTIAVDPKGRITTKITSLKGVTVETVDAKGGRVTFHHGAADRLLQVVQFGEHVLRYEYDDAGYRKTSIDPNLGQWQYDYNAFGELVWQRDAKGQITSVTYDVLGRPLRRHSPDKLTLYAYDKAPFGIGKMTDVSGSDGYEESYTYDQDGRVHRKAVRIDRQLFTTSMKYDPYDRLSETHYPANFVVRNHYDEFGFLSAVKVVSPGDDLSGPGKEYWRAGKRDQFGRVTEEVLGNGLATIHEFHPRGGYEERIATSRPDSNAIVDLKMIYDLAGNLDERQERVSRRRENFDYDEVNRLIGWKVNGRQAGVYRFDAAGRLLYKSDVGTYTYHTGTEGGPVHAVKSIEGRQGATKSYEYDRNGNMIESPQGHFEYNAQNSVEQLFVSDELWSSFRYTADGNRYSHFYRSQAMTVRTMYVGAFETINEHTSLRSGGRPDLIRNRVYISSDTGVIAALEHATHYDPWLGERPKWEGNAGFTKSAITAHYFHKDQLGSVTQVTDASGKIALAYTYDPWGKRCGRAGTTAVAECDTYQGHKTNGPRTERISGSFHRGFTGHEHIDHLNLVHMNGRIYNPTIARFVSADPQVEFPNFTQSYDRYAYVYGNPLRHTDPSGFGIGKFFKDLGRAIARPFEEAGKWLGKNWREVVVVIVVVAITVASGGTAIGAYPVLVGMIAGAAGGALGAALYGGDFSDVLSAAAKGAVMGGISAGIAEGIGAMYLGDFGAAAAHGASQGALAEIQGGKFSEGFLAGTFSSLAASGMQKYQLNPSSVTGQVLVGAIVGGTASELGGGKFANGAIAGAFVVAFNHMKHPPKPPAEDPYLDISLGVEVNAGSSVGVGPKMYDILGDNPKPGFSTSCCGGGWGFGTDTVIGGAPFTPSVGFSLPAQLGGISAGGTFAAPRFGTYDAFMSVNLRGGPFEVSFVQRVRADFFRMYQAAESRIYGLYGVSPNGIRRFP